MDDNVYLPVSTDELGPSTSRPSPATAGRTPPRPTKDDAFGQLLLAAGEYDKATTALARCCERSDVTPATLVDLIEAAVRSGQPGVAIDARLRLFERTTDDNEPSTQGARARAFALLSEDSTAEHHFEASLDCYVGCMDWAGAARTHLLYGEWLRRQRRRIDARLQLRQALEIFEAQQSTTFAQRARNELLATAASARTRALGTELELTDRERQVAIGVAQGRTNREIAQRLFISPATVDYHLRKIFSKLGLRSRRELFGWLPQDVHDERRAGSAAASTASAPRNSAALSRAS